MILDLISVILDKYNVVGPHVPAPVPGAGDHLVLPLGAPGTKLQEERGDPSGAEERSGGFGQRRHETRPRLKWHQIQLHNGNIKISKCKMKHDQALSD